MNFRRVGYLKKVIEGWFAKIRRLAGLIRRLAGEICRRILQKETKTAKNPQVARIAAGRRKSPPSSKDDYFRKRVNFVAKGRPRYIMVIALSTLGKVFQMDVKRS